MDSSPISKSTRKATDMWLIGPRQKELHGRKLPSRKEIMALFFHYHLTEKQTIHSSATVVTNEVLNIWKKANIPTQKKQHIVEKVEKLFTEWKKLKKNKENKKKRSITLEAKERKFEESLNAMFDIAHANALQIMTIKEDKTFLLAQREKGRPGKIGSVDTTLARKENRKRKREEEIKLRRNKEKERQNEAKLNTTVSPISHLISSSDSLDEAGSSSHEDAIAGCSSRSIMSTSISLKVHKRARKSIITSELAATLDRTKVSDRKATFLLNSVANTLGHDISGMSINRSSIKRERARHRQKWAESIKNLFDPAYCLTVHWDGKLLPDMMGHETVDRLPILVSGGGEEQLLGVPKLINGMGRTIASAVENAVKSWKIENKVRAMCFDTTASNTGSKSGACCLLESKLAKKMLHLACRHHILELILEIVFTTCLDIPSSGPDIQLFKTFRKQWSLINKERFQTFVDEEHNVNPNIRKETIMFAEKMLKTQQPRDDYMELLELIIIFMGGTPPKDIHFRSPGAMHRARWMAKAIYAFKVFMFRGQFELGVRETVALRRICVFVATIYIKAWYQAPIAASAPRVDIELLNNLILYKNNDLEVANAALSKFLRHLWYLSEELVPLAFFDNDVSIETKRSMVQSLNNEGNSTRKIKANLEEKDLENCTLEKFITTNSFQFFEMLSLKSEYLMSKDPSQWEQDEEFLKGKEICKHLRIVNDTAERGVALMEEFNKLYTYDEEQKQYILLVVKEHRKKYPDSKKQTIMKALTEEK